MNEPKNKRRKSSVPPYRNTQKRVQKTAKLDEDKKPLSWKKPPTPLQYLREKTRTFDVKSGTWVYHLPRNAGTECRKVCTELAQIFCQDALLQEVLG